MKRPSAWDELQERWIASEPLTDREERERLEQAARDPAAARELAFYERARRWIESPRTQAEGDARFAEHVLKQVKAGGSARLRLVSEGQPKPAEGRDRPARGRRPAASAAAWLLAGAL